MRVEIPIRELRPSAITSMDNSKSHYSFYVLRDFSRDQNVVYSIQIANTQCHQSFTLEGIEMILMKSLTSCSYRLIITCETREVILW